MLHLSILIHSSIAATTHYGTYFVIFAHRLEKQSIAAQRQKYGLVFKAEAIEVKKNNYACGMLGPSTMHCGFQSIIIDFNLKPQLK